MAAWFFAGWSCNVTIAMEMHMKMFVEVSMDLNVALRGQQMYQTALAGEIAMRSRERRETT